MGNKIELKEGAKILYCVDGKREILEGTISRISPSGQFLNVDGTWYCQKPSLDHRGPLGVEILDELPGETSTQEILKKGQESWPRPSYR